MLIEQMRRTGASYGRHPRGSFHTAHQTVAVLSRLWTHGKKAVVATLASLSVRCWASATRFVFRVPGRLSAHSRFISLLCPVPGVLGRCGGAPAGSTRACAATCECGALSARKHGYPSCQSASAQKSEHPETRANSPASDEGDWKRGGCARNPRCFSTGSFQSYF